LTVLIDHRARYGRAAIRAGAAPSADNAANPAKP
jgi:hypothetical protein